MITNIQPVKMAFTSYVSGYREIYLLHNSYADLDVVGKVFWVDSVIQPVDTDISNLGAQVSSLSPSTSYNIEGAYYDQMVDSALRAARFGMSISDILAASTATEPSVSSYTVESDNVDIGVSPPILVINLAGTADLLEVQWSPAGQANWTTVYLGGFTTRVSIPNIPIGTVDVRVRGTISFPDGQTTSTSNWITEANVVLDWQYTPPSAPTGLSFTTALLAEPSERYDVKVDWSWTQSTGSNVREFVLWGIDKTLYNSNPSGDKWAGATLINSGTAQSVVVTNHPFDSTQRYRVAAIAWGPSGDTTTFSTEVDYTITAATPIDNDFTTQTGIEVTYAHIKGLLNDGGIWKQTFLIDAATGAVAIGLLDGGEAPISFDPVAGVVNVKGGVITEEIVSANFVMANLTGESNPKFYSAAKPTYGDTSDGIFIGYDDADGIFKFDLGNQTKYIRWDGSDLRISGNVIISTGVGDISLEDTNIFQAYIYQVATSQPATPTNSAYPPPGWSTIPPTVVDPNKLYVSTAKVNLANNALASGESWSTPYVASGVDGTDGTDGDRGAGFYAQGGVGYGVTFNTVAATSFFNSLFGTGPILYDVLTQYDSTDPSIAITRQWNGSSWIAAALTVHGDMIVDGTIRTEKLVANAAVVNELGAETIYDKAAYDSGDPETNYTMKIDLVAGSIHIR